MNLQSRRVLFLFVMLLISAATTPVLANNNCAPIADIGDFYTDGWSYDATNDRFQSRTTITKDNVSQLALKWAFRLDGGVSPHSAPLISSDTVFVGTQAGQVHAIDRETGCTRWTFQVPDGNEARTALTQGTVPIGTNNVTLVFFGTSDGRVHALDAATGALRWMTDVADHSMTMLTGTPTFHNGQLYVPVSSTEVMMAMLPWYGCCTFKGNVVALDAASGDINWRTHVIREDSVETGTHHLFVQTRGPSGAPIWSAPTIDAKNNQLLVGTGENYSSPATDTSDAIIAMDLETGTINWVQQYLAGDAFNVACGMSDHGNCPEEDGPDLDFGAPPILSQTIDGVDILLAGQKSGGIYALHPDTGNRIWEKTIGRGGVLGGIHWGMAADATRGLVYVPVSDMEFVFANLEGTPAPGLYALDIMTGEQRWSKALQNPCEGKEFCNPGLSAALSATPDLVFAGWLDGSLRAYDAENGTELWKFDTIGDYAVANADEEHGRLAQGGTIDVHGPLVADDMVFVQSGYAHQLLHAGNVLLAFKLAPGSMEQANE